MNPRKFFRRLTLRRGDGRVYLDRWGIGLWWLGTIYVHKMSAPDPGVDLHDHPWAFVTIPLVGGYQESRATVRNDRDRGRTRGFATGELRRPFRPRVMRLNECHTITHLLGPVSWSLVITGPVKQDWGFFIFPKTLDEIPLARQWVDHVAYESTDAGKRRAMQWTSNYKPDGATR